MFHVERHTEVNAHIGHDRGRNNGWMWLYRAHSGHKTWSNGQEICAHEYVICLYMRKHIGRYCAELTTHIIYTQSVTHRGHTWVYAYSVSYTGDTLLEDTPLGDTPLEHYFVSKGIMYLRCNGMSLANANRGHSVYGVQNKLFHINILTLCEKYVCFA